MPPPKTVWCRLVVFGGCTQANKRLSEVYTLDLASWEWQKHTTEEQVPPPLPFEPHYSIQGPVF